MRRLGVTLHVAQKTARSGGSAIVSRTIRHEGYAKSIHARRGIEKVFGWIKAFCGLRQFKLRGQETVCVVFGLHVIAYNLIRLGNMLRPTVAAACTTRGPKVCANGSSRATKTVKMRHTRAIGALETIPSDESISAGIQTVLRTSRHCYQ